MGSCEIGTYTTYKIGEVELERVRTIDFKDVEEKEGLTCTICDEDIKSKTFYHSHDRWKFFCNRCFKLLKKAMKQEGYWY
jgi:tRNA(Ile2) C34 agmatinyltransferase TiaS